MKVLVAGSRSIIDFDLFPYIPLGTELIISGGANGIDKLAEDYADKHKISKLIIRPRYDLYGKAAPIKRNQMMVELADAVIVIWDGISKGASYTAKYAQKFNKPLVLVDLTKPQVITTGCAGGLHKSPWGISRAEPIGSSNYPPLAKVALPPQMRQLF